MRNDARIFPLVKAHKNPRSRTGSPQSLAAAASWRATNTEAGRSLARAGEYDRVHIGTWVAGTQPDLVDIPLSGTATYTGHAIGNVSNNGASYVAVGEFRQVWNSGTRAGAVNIDNLDGGNYSGFTGAPGNGRDFSGTISGIGGTGIGRSGNVDGTFYASPTSPVAGQGGSFAINGANYSASGTFAAQK
jgi:hypothetical protein